MAKKVYLNTYITKAIYSGFFFTRTDDKRDKTINENKNVSDKTWNSRFDVIDSPNNIDGIIISLKGIYVVRRFRPLQFDSKTNSFKPLIKSLVYQSNQVNKDFYNEVRTCDQISIAKSWAQNPTIQNIRYIILDDIVLGAVNRSPNYKITDIEQMRVILDTVSNRDQFPLLYKVGYVPHLYNVLDSFDRQSSNKELAWLNDIVKKNRENGQKYYGDDYEALVSAFCARATELDQMHRQFQARTIDLDKYPGFKPARSFMDRVVQADDYLFDKLCLQVIKEKNQAEQKKQAADQKNEAKADKDRTGLKKLRELDKGILNDQINKATEQVRKLYNFAMAQQYKGQSLQNEGMLQDIGVIGCLDSKNTNTGREYSVDKSFQSDINNFEYLSKQFESTGLELRQFMPVFKKDQNGNIVRHNNLDDEEFNSVGCNINALAEYLEQVIIQNIDAGGKIITPAYAVAARFQSGKIQRTLNMLPQWEIDQDKDLQAIKNSNIKIIQNEEQFNQILKAFLNCLYWYIVYDRLCNDKECYSLVQRVVQGQGINDREVQALVRKTTDIQDTIQSQIGQGIFVQSKHDVGDKNNKRGPLLQKVYKIIYPVQHDINSASQADNIYSKFKNICKDKIEKIDSNQTEIGFVKLQIQILVSDNDGQMQATQTLNTMFENHRLPQWKRVLLGEGLDGNPVNCEKFMGKSNNVSDRAYAIYAGSRSGKGIMTNTLLVHAICSGVKIAYIDGKPDTSIQLGQLAWKKGKEAFIFDGAYDNTGEFVKGRDLESFANGLRKQDETLLDERLIPQELRVIQIQTGKENTVRTVRMVHVIQYYKCLEAIQEIIKYRAQHPLEKNDWFMAVIDECRAMAEAEMGVRKAFEEALKKMGISGASVDTAPVKTEKNKEKWNQSVDFMANWFNWMDSIRQNFVDIQTKSLGPSQTNLFFIFQGSKWIKTNNRTTMSAILNSLRLGKFIGNDGMEGGAEGQYGNSGVEKDYKWARDIKTNKTWALINGSDANISNDKVTRVFRPYTLYGNQTEQIDAMNKGQSVLDLTGDANKDINKTMAYYIEEVERHQVEITGRQFDAQEVLHSGYVYAQQIVQQVFGFNDLKQYVYQLKFLTKSAGDIAGQEQGQASTQAVGDVTRDATSKEKKSTGSTQPGSVRLTGATEEERLQQAMFMGVDTTNMRAPSAEYTDARRKASPQQQNNQYQQNPFARTATDRAIQQDMATGDPDIQQAQQGYFSEDQDGNTVVGDQNYGEGGELLTKDNYIPASKRAKSYGGALWQSFTMFVGRNQPFTRRGAICRAIYAMKINDLLIDEIENSVGGWGYVKTLVFSQTKIMVNGKRLNPHDYLQDQWGNIDLQLAINADKIISRFRNLQSLQFDDDAYYKFFDQLDKYEDNRIKHVFNKLKQLRALCNITTGVVISRHEGLNQTYGEQADQLAKKGIEQKAKDAKYKEAQEGILKKGFHYTFGRGIGTNIAQMAQLGIGFFIGGPIIGLTALMMQRKAMTKAYGQPQNGNTNRRNNNNNNTYRPMLG